MTAAIATSRPILPGRTPRGSSCAESPVLLVVGNRELHRLSLRFLASRLRACAFGCAQADALRFVGRRAFDLILMDIDASLLEGFALASKIRAFERRRGACRTAALVACTSSECRYRDCMVGGNAFDGAAKMPHDVASLAACVDRWCIAADIDPRREPLKPDSPPGCPRPR